MPLCGLFSEKIPGCTNTTLHVITHCAAAVQDEACFFSAHALSVTGACMQIYGIKYGLRGFYDRNAKPVELNARTVEGIHLRGGTILVSFSQKCLCTIPYFSAVLPLHSSMNVCCTRAKITPRQNARTHKALRELLSSAMYISEDMIMRKTQKIYPAYTLISSCFLSCALVRLSCSHLCSALHAGSKEDGLVSPLCILLLPCDRVPTG